MLSLQNANASVHVCIAQTLQLLDGEGQDEIIHHLNQATQLGSARAAFLLWQHNATQLVRHGPFKIIGRWAGK